MNDTKKKLPIGIEDFGKLRKQDCYYIDKTGFIRELLQNGGEINLITRPRRFGKSLNMSMLENFFGLDGEAEIFNGLEITKEQKLCEANMGKYPVISISLKDIDADSYEVAYDMTVMLIKQEAWRYLSLMDSERLSKSEKEAFSKLLEAKMEPAVLSGSLKLLTHLLEKHYNQKVILLIDEYDVPLARAHAQGYYEQLIWLIRSLFHQVLKTNRSLQMAVLTGCMRISKESIFTGLNNLNILSVTDVECEEYFGFTDREVRELLNYYELSDKYDVIKEWYDGYRFGNVEIYCPWDVICYTKKLRTEPEASPENYWCNTSSNEVVRRFIQSSKDNGTTKREIERLIGGESIEKEIHQELTYQDMYQSIENLWSVLFTTGYLTQRGTRDGRTFRLSIPNREICEIFTIQIMEFFQETVKKDGELLGEFCQALCEGKAENVEKKFSEYLRKTISIRDTSVKKEMKENFYHGILLGILGVKAQWSVASNQESGEGYGDILVEVDEGEPLGIVLEVKYAHDGNLESACQKALEQVEQKQYAEYFYDEGIDHVLKYGIACYKKRCKVMLAKSKVNRECS